MSNIIAARDFPVSSPRSKQAFLPSLPKELYHLMTTFLKQSEVTYSLLRASKNTQELTTFARWRVKQLSLAANQKPLPLLPDHLNHVLHQYPNFSSLDLGGRTRINGDLLIKTFKARPIVGFYARGASVAVNQANNIRSIVSPWVAILNALNPLTLEHLDLTRITQGPNSLRSFLPEFASRCPNLKTLKIPDSQAMSIQSCLRLISLLPQSFEYLGPHWASIDEVIAAAMMARFQSEKITGCKLAFETESDEKAVEMQFALLRFLPLNQMKEISLSIGPKNEEMFNRTLQGIQHHLPPVFSAAMIDYIATQTEKNFQLEKLAIVGLMESEELLPSLLRLINSLTSDRLRELTILAKQGVISDLTPIAEALMKKLPQWRNIAKITVNELTMDHLLDSASSSSSAFNLLAGAKALFEEEQAFQEMAVKMLDESKQDEHISHSNEMEDEHIQTQIEALSHLSIPQILAYYAQVHTKNDPASPLQPNQIFAYIRAQMSKNHPFAWTNTIELIKQLETFFGQEKQQIDR